MLSKKTYLLFIAVLMVLLVSGCKTIVSDVKRGFSDIRQGFSAGLAESQADAAYESADYAKAFPLYLEAAQAGKSYSQFMVGTMYMDGEGTGMDEGAGIQWIQTAAGNGYPPAMYSVGLFNLFGFGVKQDVAAAASHFEKAAEQEHGLSMLAIGTMNAVGLGVERNPREAIRWFRMAKAQGFLIEDELLANPEQVFKIVFKNQAPQQIALSNVSKKEQLRQIQQQLDELGYKPGPIDGLMGSSTRAAIRSFQKEAGLPVNGQITEQTIYVLNLTF